MSDDLVKRLRNVEFWQADCSVRMQAAARIEELEDALRSILTIPNSPSAQGIIKVFAKSALMGEDNG